MIIADSGFFVALADESDAHHARATAAAATLDEPWVTTWPVLTESCHLIGRRLSVHAAIALVDDAVNAAIEVWDPPRAAWARVPALMRRYASLPMDLADASLLLLAEHLGHGRILTTDQRDFGAYRWKSRKPFFNLLEHLP